MRRELKSRMLVALLASASACNGGAVTDGPADLAGAPPSDGTAAPADAAQVTDGEPPRDGPMNCNGPVTTAGVQCGYQHDAYNASASVKTNSTSVWSCNATQRSLTANGIPDHAAGTFPNPNCPNTIKAWSVSASMTLAPTVMYPNGNRAMVVGYAFNGVKFDPATAGTCSYANGQASCSLIGNTGAWNIEALGQQTFNFGVDDNNAHVQPTGEYHYHGMPKGILDAAGKGQAMTLVGFALDGFPIYARYGYSDANNAASPIKTIASSYRTKAAPDANRPPVNTYPMGTFSQDWEYAAGSGDLDECNGRTGVTPEFPCGIYHYYITDTWPFIQRCLKGAAAGGMMGGPPDGGVPPGMDGGAPGGTCARDADCNGMCMGMVKGCGCGNTPMGLRCVPTCAMAADCPPGPNGMMLACRGGYCLP